MEPTTFARARMFVAALDRNFRSGALDEATYTRVRRSASRLAVLAALVPGA
ncbi:MAG: hypothetical protein HY558_00960 [Euryarchaeota archaeon]|nr:hypothetical protein [Euryarchaeota archaeon]